MLMKITSNTITWNHKLAFTTRVNIKHCLKRFTLYLKTNTSDIHEHKRDHAHIHPSYLKYMWVLEKRQHNVGVNSCRFVLHFCILCMKTYFVNKSSFHKIQFHVYTTYSCMIQILLEYPTYSSIIHAFLEYPMYSSIHQVLEWYEFLCKLSIPVCIRIVNGLQSH